MEFINALRGGFDDGKPSLLELLSEQQLSSLLPPTMRHLLTLATQRYPRHLLRLLNSFDEVYAVLALAVEGHYLLTRGGSFTEHFYGLKREKALAADVPRAAAAAPDAVRRALRLTRADVWRNLAVLVGVPYLKRKLDEAYEMDAPRRLLGQAYNQPPGPAATVRERFLYLARWFLRNVYPSINAAYYFGLLAFNLAYLFDASKYHSPLMWLTGTRVRRMNGADYQAIEALGRPRDSARRRGLPGHLAASLLSSLSVLLPTSIFALKFLEWWHASDFANQLSKRAAEALTLPPPVVPDMGEDAPVAKDSLLPIYTVAPPADSGLCPICEGDISTATACQTGFVFCYACIHKWLQGIHPRQERFMAERRGGQWDMGRGRCAVTGRRVLGGTEGLRRIVV